MAVRVRPRMRPTRAVASRPAPGKGIRSWPHHPHEGRRHSPQRRAEQRPGDDDDAVHPARRSAHGAHLYRGSDLSEQPEIVSKNFQLDTAPHVAGRPAVCAGYEGIERRVPHYLPGDPSIDELTALYGIPREAALGGAETMYPEYRKKMKDGSCVRRSARAIAAGRHRRCASATSVVPGTDLSATLAALRR